MSNEFPFDTPHPAESRGLVVVNRAACREAIGKALDRARKLRAVCLLVSDQFLVDQALQALVEAHTALDHVAGQGGPK